MRQKQINQSRWFGLHSRSYLMWVFRIFGLGVRKKMVWPARCTVDHVWDVLRVFEGCSWLFLGVRRDEDEDDFGVVDFQMDEEEYQDEDEDDFGSYQDG